MSNFLLVRQGDTERWTLNDPATRNALSDAMVVALFEACLRAKNDASARPRRSGLSRPPPWKRADRNTRRDRRL